MMLHKSPSLLLVCSLVVVYLHYSQVHAQLSCLDESGKPVDWAIAYKFPKLSGDKLFEDGLAYSFITSETVAGSDDSELEVTESESNRESDSDTKIFLHRFKLLLLKMIGYGPAKTKLPVISRVTTRRRNKQKTSEQTSWIVSENAISSDESIIMRTLSVVYDEERGANINSIFYNDDPSDTQEPKESDDEGEDTQKKVKWNNRRAHAKGVLLFDEKSGDGLWLTHSVPRFPPVRGMPLKYPESGVNNGQTFMCISFRIDEAGTKIVDHLVNMRPLVYNNQISEKMYSLIPELKNLDIESKMKRRRVPVQPKLSQLITTKGGQVLHLFAKSVSFDQDMYAGWIDEELNSDLYVETWRNGNGGPLDSSCPKTDFHINNVKDLKYDANFQWPYTKDHSKWAITEKSDVGFVCIADSNRMASQFKRGGGAVCIKCSTCWKIFSSTIQDTEPCPVGEELKNRVKTARRLDIGKIRESLDI